MSTINARHIVPGQVLAALPGFTRTVVSVTPNAWGHIAFEIRVVDPEGRVEIRRPVYGAHEHVGVLA